METPAPDRRISRRSWLLAGVAIPLFSARAADSLNVRYDGDTLHVAVPSLHFLAGKPLERLRDGAAIAYVAQLELLNEAREPVGRQQRARFVVSYDLWDEKFSVTQLAKTPRTVDGLSASATEAWCFEGLALSTLGVARDRYYWLRFDMRTGGPADLDMEADKGIGIDWLIKAFARKKSEELHWGPLEVRVRLADLPRIQGRGSRG